MGAHFPRGIASGRRARAGNLSFRGDVTALYGEWPALSSTEMSTKEGSS